MKTVQRGVASSSEGRAAGRAAKRLDPLSTAMLAIAKKPLRRRYDVVNVVSESIPSNLIYW
jgi:hypothetical protein